MTIEVSEFLIPTIVSVVVFIHVVVLGPIGAVSPVIFEGRVR